MTASRILGPLASPVPESVRAHLIFAHATSLCKEIWTPVLDDLSALLVGPVLASSFDFSGHGDSRSLALELGNEPKWKDFCPRDIFRAIAASPNPELRPRIGIGHSMGAAALVLAELERPGTFDALLLYEPILPPPELVARHADAKTDSPLAVAARRRRSSWPTKEVAASTMRGRGMFAAFEDRPFKCYIDFALMVSERIPPEVELKCKPSFEGQMYQQLGSSIWSRLGEIACPVTVSVGHSSSTLTGRPSDTLQLYEDMSRRFAKGTFQSLSGLGHFAPQEDCSRFAMLVASVAEQVLLGGGNSKMKSRL